LKIPADCFIEESWVDHIWCYKVELFCRTTGIFFSCSVLSTSILRYYKPVLRIRIQSDPYINGSPGFGSVYYMDPYPDPATWKLAIIQTFYQRFSNLCQVFSFFSSLLKEFLYNQKKYEINMNLFLKKCEKNYFCFIKKPGFGSVYWKKDRIRICIINIRIRITAINLFLCIILFASGSTFLLTLAEIWEYIFILISSNIFPCSAIFGLERCCTVHFAPS